MHVVLFTCGRYNASIYVGVGATTFFKIRLFTSEKAASRPFAIKKIRYIVEQSKLKIFVFHRHCSKMAQKLRKRRPKFIIFWPKMN